MAFVLGMSFTQFVLITRLYLKDILQDHVVLYFSGLTTMLVATVTLVYATEWTIVSWRMGFALMRILIWNPIFTFPLLAQTVPYDIQKIGLSVFLVFGNVYFPISLHSN